MPPSPEPFVVFAGGGSGGHLFPSLAIASELRELSPTARMLFVGSAKAIDQVIAQGADLEFVRLSVPTGTDMWRRPGRSWPALWQSYRAVLEILREQRPTVILGTGGYLSVPVGLAAARLKVPLTLLEPNAVPGRATSLLSRFAAEIYAGTRTVQRKLGPRCLYTGIPVRREIAALADAPLPKNRRTLLILGGSQGARDLNTVVSTVLQELCPWENGWRVLHQTGATDIDRLRQVYSDHNSPVEVIPFLNEMTTAYRQAGLVISRAGAVTLAELTCAGIPAILWPHPEAIRQHQLRNAEEFTQCGGGLHLTARTIPAAVEQLRNHLRSVLSTPTGFVQMTSPVPSTTHAAAAREIARRLLMQ